MSYVYIWLEYELYTWCDRTSVIWIILEREIKVLDAPDLKTICHDFIFMSLLLIHFQPIPLDKVFCLSLTLAPICLHSSPPSFPVSSYPFVFSSDPKSISNPHSSTSLSVLSHNSKFFRIKQISKMLKN